MIFFDCSTTQYYIYIAVLVVYATLIPFSTLDCMIQCYDTAATYCSASFAVSRDKAPFTWMYQYFRISTILKGDNLHF